MAGGNDVKGRDKRLDEKDYHVPRILDYQIAGIIAGGLAGEVAHQIFKYLNYQAILNEPSLIFFGAILGFFFWGRIMRFLK